MVQWHLEFSDPPREVDWNTKLVQGDLAQGVQQLKRESGEGLWVGGVTLP